MSPVACECFAFASNHRGLFSILPMDPSKKSINLESIMPVAGILDKSPPQKTETLNSADIHAETTHERAPAGADILGPF